MPVAGACKGAPDINLLSTFDFPLRIKNAANQTGKVSFSAVRRSYRFTNKNNYGRT